VEQNGRYLMVEERDKQSGRRVFNQPAGHLDPGETLLEAALRETREETCWQVQLTGVLGIGLYTAPSNGLTYFRTTFLARPVALLEHLARDPDIDRVHWLSYEEIRDESARMRSPLVLASIERQRSGLCYPLDLVYAP
jgi:8-oxo-dGTP pyrophosphatase MutT (NUDIX family)